MSTEPHSPLHQSVGADSHAHPSPVTTTIANPHMIALLAQVTFDVKMHGLAANSNAQPCKMYHPRLRKSQVTQQDYVDQVSLLPCLIQSFPENYACFINIDVSSLLYDMIDAFYEERTSHPALQSLHWSLGSGDLHTFVYNFISIQDCFQNTPAGPCIFVKCSIDWFSFPLIAVNADIAWYPPAFDFMVGPAQIRPGARYIIAPCRRPILQEPGISGCKSFPDYVRYVVTKSSSMVKWDHKAKLFRMQAPDKLEGNTAAVLETIIQAKIITRFPEKVRFERRSRYAIKFNTVHARQFDSVTETHRALTTLILAIPPHKSTESLQLYGCRHGPTSLPDSLVDRVDRGPDPDPDSECYKKGYAESAASSVSMHNVHDLELEPGAKVSRKRTNSSHADNATRADENFMNSAPDIQLKRQKLEKNNMADSHVESPPTNLPYPMLQSMQDDTPDAKSWTRESRHSGVLMNTATFSIKIDSPSSQLQNESDEVIHKKPNRVRNERYPTPPPSTNSMLGSSSDYGNYFHEAGHPCTHTSPIAQGRNGPRSPWELSQDTIQHNYHEFEAMALCQSKNQADWGDASFEEIFMEESDAEDWRSSDLDDLGEEMDG
ncbi:hypothetical protein COCMIDRAFT_29221 [Bipolaris oryzae ATCC 44560]|uniref:Uncharacterized protein n=1 Tax=Bipolaris oryzae ATCC 44560 TaxID=930090 RepID=W6YRL8_COCMI|nr:uncharacterized protein COCMIDRAFT_29221 [Bipolaris oryzae ATCC 44560]EUC42092.1 hypothetical protein COCMIDRAFT_29221 [Bipolaris oryzae ATCC 44560]